MYIYIYIYIYVHASGEDSSQLRLRTVCLEAEMKRHEPPPLGGSFREFESLTAPVFKAGVFREVFGKFCEKLFGKFVREVFGKFCEELLGSSRVQSSTWKNGPPPRARPAPGPCARGCYALVQAVYHIILYYEPYIYIYIYTYIYIYIYISCVHIILYTHIVFIHMLKRRQQTQLTL